MAYWVGSRGVDSPSVLFHSGLIFPKKVDCATSRTDFPSNTYFSAIFMRLIVIFILVGQRLSAERSIAFHARLGRSQL